MRLKEIFENKVLTNFIESQLEIRWKLGIIPIPHEEHEKFRVMKLERREDNI